MPPRRPAHHALHVATVVPPTPPPPHPPVSPASSPALQQQPAQPPHNMPDRKRKRASPRPAPTLGFATRDQRLPPSPPLADLPLHSAAGIMAAVRARYRHAVDRLFGAPPTVLNAACIDPAFAHAADCPGDKAADCDAAEHASDSSPSPASHPSSPCRSPSPQHAHLASLSSSPSVRVAKRRRADPADQVVPASGAAAPHSAASARVHAAVPAVSHSVGVDAVDAAAGDVAPGCNSEMCTCADSLWKAGGIGPDVMLRTAEELSERIILLYRRVIDPVSNDVDYSSLVHEPDFHHYLSSARKLRYFDPLLLSRSERKAFFLNVYNSLMIHAIAVMSKPRTMFERVSMYNSAAYNIGGRAYSLNMIEHGVLRANRRGCGPFATIPFGETDARRLCALPEVDPRIHFALNCGARSCPAVRFYAAESLDRSLDSATRTYLLDMDVDKEQRVITLPKLLQWYKADFCADGSIDTVIEWTLPHLTEAKRSDAKRLLAERDSLGLPLKIVFAGYDWTVNDRSQ